jgi:hypothetical protein
MESRGLRIRQCDARVEPFLDSGASNQFAFPDRSPFTKMPSPFAGAGQLLVQV